MTEPVGRPNVVSYDIDTRTAALVGVDFQRGFGHGFEPVPHADEAVATFIALARAWRAAGGTVIHVHTTYTPERTPTGRITDFVPGIADALSEGSPLAAFYDGMVEDDDVLVAKTTFSAVLGSDLPAELARRGLDTAVVGGLTTPICVQTTVDALSMTGTKVCLVRDACASQPMGDLTAEQAHDAAVQRMGYLFATVATAAEIARSIGAVTAKAG
jgi:nicotinamidase-related amidase